MYESHFGLTSRPFPELADADYYFPSAAMEEARTAILRCLTRGAGAALVLGPPGTGKTMLCERVAHEIADRFPIASLNWGHPSTRQGLLQAILYKLDLPFRNLDEGELRLSLVDHLTRSASCPHGIVLVIDEAHLLSMELLEEVRILTNLVANREQRVRVVLAGQSSLEDTLAIPRMLSLQQRIAARCYMVGLRREETRAYVTFTIARCGGIANNIFHATAFPVIHELTRGVLRLVNQLCDHALIMAYLREEWQVSGELLREAWADLQQLPIHLPTYRPSAPRLEDVIEYGTLDDVGPSIPFRRTSVAAVDSASEPHREQATLEIDRPEVTFRPHIAEESLSEMMATHLVENFERSDPDDVEAEESPAPSAAYISDLHHDEADADPEPPAPAGSVAVPALHNLFGGDFVDQESVEDRYTHLRISATLALLAEAPPASHYEIQDAAPQSNAELPTPLSTFADDSSAGSQETEFVAHERPMHIPGAELAEAMPDDQPLGFADDSEVDDIPTPFWNWQPPTAWSTALPSIHAHLADGDLERQPVGSTMDLSDVEISQEDAAPSRADEGPLPDEPFVPAPEQSELLIKADQGEEHSPHEDALNAHRIDEQQLNENQVDEQPIDHPQINEQQINEQQIKEQHIGDNQLDDRQADATPMDGPQPSEAVRHLSDRTQQELTPSGTDHALADNESSGRRIPLRSLFSTLESKRRTTRR